MATLSARYDVEGVAVDARVASANLARFIPDALGSRIGLVPGDGQPARAADITLSLEPGLTSPDLADQRARFAFPPMHAYLSGGDYLLVDDVGFVRVTPSQGQIRGGVHSDADPDACWRFVALTIRAALLECLRARGRFMVHAAGVLAPNGEALFLIGGSGAGKTTATLALAQQGWSVLSDDTVFVQRQDGRLLTIAETRPFHLGPDLVAGNPQLKRFLRTPPPHEPQGKLWLDVGRAFPGQGIRRSDAPARLYYPEICDQPRSQIAPLSAREALTRLFHQSVFVFAHPELIAGHLSALQALVDGAGTYRLLCGRDVLVNPREFSALLEQAPCPSVALA